MSVSGAVFRSERVGIAEIMAGVSHQALTDRRRFSLRLIAPQACTGSWTGGMSAWSTAGVGRRKRFFTPSIHRLTIVARWLLSLSLIYVR